MKYESVVPFGLLSCALAKWQPLDEASLRKAFKTNDHTLAAYILADDKSLGAFEEEWESVVSSAKEGNVVTVDCSASQALCREFDVVSFPTIRLHRQDGHTERYRGPRKEKDITAFSQRMSRPAVSYIDAKNATSFTAIDDVVVVAYLEQDNSGLRERFTKAAEQYRDRYSFAIRHRKGHGVSLECQNNVNVEQLSITDLSDALAIENFVKRCAQPLIPEFTRRNELEYSKLGKSIVHYFTSSDEDRESYISAIRPLAKRYQEYLLFVTTDMNEYPQMLSMTGHKSGASNVVSVVNPLNGAVFPYRGKDITADTIEKFLGDVSSGKVKAWDGVHVDEGIKHEEL